MKVCSSKEYYDLSCLPNIVDYRQTCKHCGDRFYPGDSGNISYCVKCKDLAIRMPKTWEYRKCTVCGKTFNAKIAAKNIVWCGSACRGIYKRSLEKNNKPGFLSHLINVPTESTMQKDLESYGLVAISTNRGNNIFMNPDMYSIRDNLLHSYEIKNHIRSGYEFLSVSECFVNGAWANTSSLIFYRGNEIILKKFCERFGVGLYKFPFSCILEPLNREIDTDIQNAFSYNRGVECAIKLFNE